MSFIKYQVNTLSFPFGVTEEAVANIFKEFFSNAPSDEMTRGKN